MLPDYYRHILSLRGTLRTPLRGNLPSFRSRIAQARKSYFVIRKWVYEEVNRAWHSTSAIDWR